MMKMSEKSERRSSYVSITVVTCPPSEFLMKNVHMADSKLEFPTEGICAKKICIAIGNVGESVRNTL